MVGEEYGWYALDGWQIMVLLLEMLVIVMIPGFLLSLAIFPKRLAMSMSERLALSCGLGLTPPFIVSMLNITLEVKVNFVTSIIVLLFISIASILAFLNRGGNLNLLEWYRVKGAAKS